MVRFCDYSSGKMFMRYPRVNKASGTLGLAAILCMLTPASLPAATDVSSQVRVTHTGFGRNRATGMWTATLTVTNKSGSPISGPIQVALKNLSTNAAIVNNTTVLNGSPAITLSTGSLAPGASMSMPIQFTNPSNNFINFTPVTYAGGSQP
jgi:uncharacterized protein